MAKHRTRSSKLDIYFVTSITNKKIPIFRAPGMAALFIESLYCDREEGTILIHEFVVMPDHFHLLLGPLALDIGGTLELIQARFEEKKKLAFALNLDVWERGYTAHRIRDAAEYLRYVEYIHLKPVRELLAANAEQYPYSSAFPGFKLDSPHAEFLGDQSPQAHKIAG